MVVAFNRSSAAARIKNFTSYTPVALGIPKPPPGLPIYGSWGQVWMGGSGIRPREALGAAKIHTYDRSHSHDTSLNDVLFRSDD